MLCSARTAAIDVLFYVDKSDSPVVHMKLSYIPIANARSQCTMSNIHVSKIKQTTNYLPADPADPENP